MGERLPVEDYAKIAFEFITNCDNIICLNNRSSVSLSNLSSLGK